MLGTKEVKDGEAFEFMTEMIQRKFEIATEGDKSDNRLLFDTVRIGKNIRYLRMTDCVLSPLMYKHIVQPLLGCNKLENLFLMGTVGLPEELGECIAEMTSLTKLDMSRCYMTQSMSRSITKGLSHCVKLETLNLHRNNLTDCLGNLFGRQGFPSLRSLSLTHTSLSRKELYSLFAALRNGKLPNLEFVELSNNILTGCLKDLLTGTTLPKLRHLGFDETKLRRDDITSIASAVQSGKCPQLKDLRLSGNKLKDCLQDLLDADYPALNDLSISNASLSVNDISCLGKASHKGRLPKLTILDLSKNILKNCFCELLSVDFPSLEYLYLSNTELSKANIKSLSTAVHEGRMPKLEGLRISDNILTGCMEDLFGDNHKFPKLEFLDLYNTQLNRDDLKCLTEALASPNRLPRHISLQKNNLGSMEEEVENLIQAVLVTAEVYLSLDQSLFLYDNNLSEGFCQRMKSLCQNTDIYL